MHGDLQVNLLVFYYFEHSGEQVASTSPVLMSSDTVRSRLVARLEGDDDYIGLVDEEENTLQIMLVGGAGGYWVELPMAEERASYGKVVSSDELFEMLQRLPRRFRPRDFPDFRFRTWGSGAG